MLRGGGCRRRLQEVLQLRYALLQEVLQLRYALHQPSPPTPFSSNIPATGRLLRAVAEEEEAVFLRAALL